MFNFFVVAGLIVGSVSLRVVHAAQDRGKCNRKVLMVIVHLKMTGLRAHLEAVMRHRALQAVENSIFAFVECCWPITRYRYAFCIGNEDSAYPIERTLDSTLVDKHIVWRSNRRRCTSNNEAHD